MTDLGTLPAPLNSFSTAGNINESGGRKLLRRQLQLPRFSMGKRRDDRPDCAAAAGNGTAGDLGRRGINDLGEIAVQVFDPASATMPFPLALMIPDTDPAAAQLGFNAVSTDPLPDHVRTALQQRMKRGPFGRAPR
jgi:hypothetical protein